MQRNVPFLSVLTIPSSIHTQQQSWEGWGMQCERVDGGFYIFMLTQSWKRLGKKLWEVTVVAGNRDQ